MKILIIAYDFPPLNTIAAQRPYSWAKYWSRLGHTVYVLTAVKYDFDGVLDGEFSFDGVEMVTVGVIPYLPFLRPIDDLSSEFNYPTSKKRPLSVVEKLKKGTKFVREFIGLGAVFSLRNFWVNPAVRQGLIWHREHNFDFMVSTHGPPATHIVAKRLQDKLNIFWVADYRDLWAGTHYQSARGIFARLQEVQENKVVARANILTTVSEPLRYTLAQRFDKPTFTIANGFDTEEIPQLCNTHILGSQGKIKLLYTGTVRAGKQVVQPLFEALSILRNQYSDIVDRLEIAFYGYELGEIPYLIEEYQVFMFVKVLGMVPRAQSLALQRQADGLLFLDWLDTSTDGILTGKLFEYMYSGRPILGIGSYDWLAPGRLLQESGCGLCLGNDVGQITEVLESLIKGDSLPYSPQPEVLARYHRKALAQSMLEIIETFRPS